MALLLCPERTGKAGSTMALMLMRRRYLPTKARPAWLLRSYSRLRRSTSSYAVRREWRLRLLPHAVAAAAAPDAASATASLLLRPLQLQPRMLPLPLQLLLLLLLLLLQPRWDPQAEEVQELHQEMQVHKLLVMHRNLVVPHREKLQHLVRLLEPIQGLHQHLEGS